MMQLISRQPLTSVQVGQVLEVAFSEQFDTCIDLTPTPLEEPECIEMLVVDTRAKQADFKQAFQVQVNGSYAELYCCNGRGESHLIIY